MDKDRDSENKKTWDLRSYKKRRTGRKKRIKNKSTSLILERVFMEQRTNGKTWEEIEASMVAELEAEKQANEEALAALEASHKAEVEGLEGNIAELKTAYNNKVDRKYLFRQAF